MDPAVTHDDEFDAIAASTLLLSEQSRLGGVLCRGLPWMLEELYVEPRGMLARPAGCAYPRACAVDRCCYQAHARELDAWVEHRRWWKYDLAHGTTDVEDFDVWCGIATKGRR